MINRRQKKLFLIIFFICFFYFFVRYGFDQKDPHSNFGENLDRNYIERSSVRKRKNQLKSSDTIGEAAIWNAVVESKTTTESVDDKILKDFLEGKKKIDENFVNKRRKTERLYSTKKLQSNDGNSKQIEIRNADVEAKATTESVDDKILKEFLEGKKKIDENFVSKRGKTKMRQSTKKQQSDDVVNSIHIENPEIIELVEETTVTTSFATEPTKGIEKIEENEIIAEAPEPPDRKKEFGENGRAVTLPSDLPDNIKQLVDDGWKNYQFNEYVSNLISVKRSLLDYRTDYCHDIHKHYLKHLPPVTVIIVFYNEAWSTLLRTIHSILDRSPVKLIKEILLVDDYSDMPHLKAQLDDYVRDLSKVRLLRNAKREGLIRSRNRGAIYANADILVFLDSHVECTNGWLEPLIDRIARNKTSIAVPVIETINDETFEFQPNEHSHYISLGGFGWNMQFRWFYMKTANRKHADAPCSTPTIAGGLFAISSSYFKKIGMYDPGLELWGGENLEISFKTWMCGGHIQTIPCSHVGHVFRKKSPYNWTNNAITFRKNCMRIANVWMDDYAKFYMYATGFNKVDYGDISERLQLRKDLKCESFSWYLKNVYPERSIPSEQIAYGQIENLGSDNGKCIDGTPSKNSPYLTLFDCNENEGSQFWEFNGEIYRDNYCVTVEGHNIFTKHCRKTDKQMFKYNSETKQLILKYNNECLAMTKDFDLAIETCNRKNKFQKWKLQNFDIKKNEKL